MEINDLFKNTNSKDIKKLIALLQVLADATDDGSEEDEPEEKPKKIAKSKKSTETRTPSRKGKKQPEFVNKFLDMPEKDMHKDDAGLDKKLSVHPPVARTRDFDPVQVVCRVCNKTEMIPPSLVESVSRYKCNNCAKNPG
jgi:hypothetical protein